MRRDSGSTLIRQVDYWCNAAEGWNGYAMVLNKFDSNSIHLEPMKNRTTLELIGAYHTTIYQLNVTSTYLKHPVLYKQISEKFKAAIKFNKMTDQLMTSIKHRQDITKRVIQTTRCHMESVLCGIDPTFLMLVWC